MADPLGGWITTAELAERDRLVFDTAAFCGIPVAWNLAGGYQRDRNGGIGAVLEIHRNTMMACGSALEYVRSTFGPTASHRVFTRNPLDEEDPIIRVVLGTEEVPRAWWPPAPISSAQAWVLIREWRLCTTGRWLGSPLSPGPLTGPTPEERTGSD